MGGYSEVLLHIVILSIKITFYSFFIARIDDSIEKRDRVISVKIFHSSPMVGSCDSFFFSSHSVTMLYFINCKSQELRCLVFICLNFKNVDGDDKRFILNEFNWWWWYKWYRKSNSWLQYYPFTVIVGAFKSENGYGKGFEKKVVFWFHYLKGNKIFCYSILIYCLLFVAACFALILYVEWIFNIKSNLHTL